ncbi:Hypp5589 [Branchiostoma lanceolatum]|uniref:Hypp5589 protein n=1 Tax=Branchiostoma lanceolatum TaxID=7740 RepID=A0A8J9VFK2_BRALA|nr:Hypp5589 [Branchiostoma lanceolatum]
MWPHTYAGLFEVYCVLKGGPLQYNITVVEIGGPTTCSRTEVDVGEEYILLLTRREDDVLAPHEVNTQTAAIPATQDNLDMVALTCGLQNFTLPLGSPGNLPENMGCPIHPNETGEQCVYAGAASHVVMSTTLSLMAALLTCAFDLFQVAL